MSDMNIKEIIEDPKAHFESPAHVLNNDNFSQDQKREILKAWHEDAEALERAKDESMSGGEPSWLQEVNEAMDKLGK